MGLGWLGRATGGPIAADRTIERARMVAQQVEARGVSDTSVLAAMRALPREDFMPPALQGAAYDDAALAIGEGQTISQPYIVAITLAGLRLTGSERVLEVGTGSGYVAALLTRLAREVYTVERIGSLAAAARERLDRLGYAAHVREGDGSLGWPEHAPYDAIAVAAVAPRVPSALIAQLSPGGRMVIPVKDGARQTLVRVTRGEGNEVSIDRLEDVRFVPLIGAEGEPVAGAETIPGARS
jgi:protein-L-isoaspartate(D-aspartate) O-methyltransferase